MIVLLGATGYIGQAFEAVLCERGKKFTPLSRKQIDYTQFVPLLNFLRDTRPEFLVNCAGYTGKPNVDACELHKADTLQGNTLFPQMVAEACEAAKVPWGHVSSGCIFAGAKISENGKIRTEKDMTQPAMRRLIEKNPSAIRGFVETDTPNFSFRDGPCSFYSGTKALGEEALAAATDQCYVWRLRIPFDEFDNARNYLSKVQRYSKVYDNVNSISHRADFARACLDTWELRAPFGIYNVTNPGFVTTRHVVERIEELLRPAKKFEFWESDEEFYKVAAKTPRSNCVMDAGKILSVGVKIRPVEEALEASLKNWRPETR